MATFKLKNNATDSGTVPGVGNYVDGVLQNAPDNFENPNFELVTTTEQDTAAAATQPSTAAPASPSTPTAAAPATPASPSAPAAPAASTTEQPSQPNTQTEGAK